MADALCAAAEAADDVDRRLEGSRVDWARDWSEAFPAELEELLA